MAELTLKILHNTVIKRFAIQSLDIHDASHKFSLQAGDEIGINWVRPAANNHWEFELKSRHGAFFNWFAYKPDVEVHGLSNGSDIDIAPQRKAFLDMIAVPEGTSGPNGYRTMFTGRLFDNNFVDHPRQVWCSNGLCSNAAGRYQFLSRTWDMCKQALNLPDFSPASQERAAIFLIKNRGALGDVDAGKLTRALEKTSWEWASLPPGRYGQPSITFAKAKQLFRDFGGVLAPGE